MADPMKTWVNGAETTVPDTIPAIRAALPEDRRAEFDTAIDTATVHTIHAVMRHWMFEAVPDPEADAIMDRLAAEEAERRNAA